MRVKVTDFGIAKLVEGSAATASQVAGTPAYMAPEQITGGRLVQATDLYALGVVLYQLLTGAAPFGSAEGMGGLWQHHLYTTPALPTGVPAPVATVIMRALAKDAADRQSSARAFAVELARAAAEAFGPTWLARSGIPLAPMASRPAGGGRPAACRRPASAVGAPGGGRPTGT